MQSKESSQKEVKQTEIECIGCDICGNASDVKATNTDTYDDMTLCYEHTGIVVKVLSILKDLTDITFQGVKI